MRHAGMARMMNFDARRPQLVGIGRAFVAQWIALCRMQKCRWHAGEVRRTQWRDTWFVRSHPARGVKRDIVVERRLIENRRCERMVLYGVSPAKSRMGQSRS